MRSSPDAQPLSDRCRTLLRDLQLIDAEEPLAVTPLTGGVASDIAKVTTTSKQFCVKFALSQLRVSERWEAPVHRNLAEYRWLDFAGSVVPGSAPRLYGCSESLHGFAMQLIDGDEVYQWKHALLNGHVAQQDAMAVGDVLGQLHAASAEPTFDDTGFHNQADFASLRTDPYLLFSAGQHPILADHLQTLTDQLLANSSVLIHGDISPKNILFKQGIPIFLDAECATLGDPAFDVAFCLNHLVLKSFHLPGMCNELLQAVDTLWRSYSTHCHWESSSALNRRVSALLPALMLARVDGKSPVEYLDEPTREQVRAVSIELVRKPKSSLRDLIEHLASGCRSTLV